jgi:hypothetical protein
MRFRRTSSHFLEPTEAPACIRATAGDHRPCAHGGHVVRHIVYHVVCHVIA